MYEWRLYIVDDAKNDRRLLNDSKSLSVSVRCSMVHLCVGSADVSLNRFACMSCFIFLIYLLHVISSFLLPVNRLSRRFFLSAFLLLLLREAHTLIQKRRIEWYEYSAFIADC